MHQQTHVQYPQLLDTLLNNQQHHCSSSFSPSFIPGSPTAALLTQMHSCKECVFEREKRMVTQSAFERALSISMYLMEEIEKLSYSQPAADTNNLMVNRQEILGLLKINDQYNSASSNVTNSYQSGAAQGNRFFSRSKSQNLMMLNGESNNHGSHQNPGQGNTSNGSIGVQNQTMLVNQMAGKINQEQQSPIVSQSVLKAGGVNATQISSLQATKKRNLF